MSSDREFASVCTDGIIERPFKVGLRNSGKVLFPIFVAILVFFWRYQGLHGFATWWHFVLILAAVPAVCFGHAFLGHFIGEKKANNFFVTTLFIVLVVTVSFVFYI